MNSRRDPFLVDLFAGGGGASEGIRRATGLHPDIAVNHCEHAIRMHERNHPSTHHYQEDIARVSPRDACRSRRPDLLWASPDCTHFSRAKGGKPVSKKIRGLAWMVVRWAREVSPRVIAMENVPEFVTWGPLGPDNRPDPKRKGETFRRFVGELEGLGYRVSWRKLVAADFGSPTTRERLFLIARRDGDPVWPTPSHGPGRPLPYRTAAECIDWSTPCPSIFDRPRPLAKATCRRIAHGLVRYVLDNPEPYIAPLRGTSPSHKSTHGVSRPLGTISAQGTHHALVAPYLSNTRNGERKGQKPRTRSVERPYWTVTAKGSQGALVSAWIAKHYTGVVGHGMERPLGTITATDHHSVCEAEVKPANRQVELPLDHRRDVAAFLIKYYGSGIGQRADRPLDTITSVDRFGLVTVDIEGEPHVVTDIGMRMLQPRELARCQGFDDDYVLIGTKRDQVARIGNSVCPQVAAAIVRANLPSFTVDPA